MSVRESNIAAVATNPLSALLTPDRQQLLAALSEADRQTFYGSVLESIFSNPAYQELVFTTANERFDQLASERGLTTGSSMFLG
jgi:hypothetical protein